MSADHYERVAGPPSTPPARRELLGREHLGSAIVLAGGVLVGAINIYLAASLLPTAVAELGGASFYAWNMTGRRHDGWASVTLRSVRTNSAFHGAPTRSLPNLGACPMFLVIYSPAGSDRPLRRQAGET
ncbi:hypothetical protein [Nonomuraea sp. GTA35]|uniref:hypothetical protein n=1 Tax=Nonomuraea sp. GTA35 TaxID=1676746 RepID=UPI0035BF70F2